MNENTFCRLVWTHAAIFPDNIVKPCCRFQNQEIETNLIQSDLEKARDSSVFQNARNQMFAGKLPNACQKCEMEELAGHKSMRQKVNAENELNIITGTEKGKLESLEWFLGNACNLRCVMCSPDRSFSWNKDADALGYEKKPLSRMDVQQLENVLPTLRKIKLIGGEPLLHREHEQILEMVCEKGRAEETHLIINSNLTIFPNESVLNYWKKIKLVELDLSLDGIGAVNEYIRYPTKWNDVEENLKKYLELARENNNFLVYITCTVSAYNTMYIAELYDWWQGFRGNKSPNIRANICWNYVMDPEHMSPFVLPEEMRREAAGEMRKRNESVAKKIENSLLSKDYTHLLPKFKIATESLDRARGIQGKKILNQLERVL
jgi:organic radical activating enzyme